MKIAKIGSYSLNLIKKFPTPLRNIAVTYGTQLLEKLPKSWSSRLYKEILLKYLPGILLQLFKMSYFMKIKQKVLVKQFKALFMLLKQKMNIHKDTQSE